MTPPPGAAAAARCRRGRGGGRGRCAGLLQRLGDRTAVVGRGPRPLDVQPLRPRLPEAGAGARRRRLPTGVRLPVAALLVVVDPLDAEGDGVLEAEGDDGLGGGAAGPGPGEAPVPGDAPVVQAGRAPAPDGPRWPGQAAEVGAGPPRHHVALQRLHAQRCRAREADAAALEDLGTVVGRGSRHRTTVARLGGRLVVEVVVERHAATVVAVTPVHLLDHRGDLVICVPHPVIRPPDGAVVDRIATRSSATSSRGGGRWRGGRRCAGRGASGRAPAR